MKLYLILFAALVAVLTLQTIHYFQFRDETSKWINKGPRFTAQDGQVLCERIQKLEVAPKECRYGK